MTDMDNNADISKLVETVRQSLAASYGNEALRLIEEIAPDAGSLSPVDAVDLLERACAFGHLSCVHLLWQVVPDFAYASWALMLALRCAHEEVARFLLERGVDLLGGVHQPRGVRALLPHEGTFTRFCLTRFSTTLFVNPLDPTVSTEVFEEFTQRRQLAGGPYSTEVNLDATCDLVARLADEGLFDATVFDDLLRATLVKAWHSLRHEATRDPHTAEMCLNLGSKMLTLHRTRGLGDARIEQILASLVVPKASPRILQFICEEAPDVFLERLSVLPWLYESPTLVRQMVPFLSPSDDEALNGTLLRLLARGGFMEDIGTLSAWDHTFTRQNLLAALDEASAAGHAEVAAWALSQLQSADAADSDDSSFGLGDLFL